MFRRKLSFLVILVIALSALLLCTMVASAGPLSGAIHTTDCTGSLVDGNIYEEKEDVCLNGGPSSNAPMLPDGDYFFQVTDPSGKVLLSQDSIDCRKYKVEGGVITYVYPATQQVKIKGQITFVDTTHLVGQDGKGGYTVALYPYNNTPNKGGVYKVWVTPCDQYSPGNGCFGFIPAWSKTDNFKVKSKKSIIPPTITVKKFDDNNANGIWDFGESEITGWQVDVIDPVGSSNTYCTPDELIVSAGNWSLTEEQRPSWLQTALIIDGVPQVVSPTTVINVFGNSGECHEVVFGNIQLSSLSAYKFYDKNMNGKKDSGECPIEGFKFVLTGTDVLGNCISQVKFTDNSGIANFSDLLPGEYVISEVLPAGGNWINTTPLSRAVTLGEGDVAAEKFGNVCYGEVAFHTKGYWHNKEGMQVITDLDILNINSLSPFCAPSTYFTSGDEPFDGMYNDGMCVDAAFNDDNPLWGPGTALAELSQYLVESNASGDPKEQLGQQLVAFVLNVRHFTGNDALLLMPDGSWQSVDDIVTNAIIAWEAGTAEDQHFSEALLDLLNNCGNIKYILSEPGRIIY